MKKILTGLLLIISGLSYGQSTPLTDTVPSNAAKVPTYALYMSTDMFGRNYYVQNSAAGKYDRLATTKYLRGYYAKLTGGNSFTGTQSVFGAIISNDGSLQSTRLGPLWSTPNGNYINLATGGAFQDLNILSNKKLNLSNGNGGLPYVFTFDGNNLFRNSDSKRALFDGDPFNGDLNVSGDINLASGKNFNTTGLISTRGGFLAGQLHVYANGGGSAAISMENNNDPTMGWALFAQSITYQRSADPSENRVFKYDQTLDRMTLTGNSVTNTIAYLSDISSSGAAYVPKTTTVAGFPLSSNVTLASLTATNSSLTFSGSYNGSAAQTVAVNLANSFAWTGTHSITANAIATTSTDVFTLRNGTVATSTIPVQYAPRMVMRGAAWNTTTTVSNPVEMYMDLRPISGTATSGKLTIRAVTNAAASADVFSIATDGTVNSASLTASGLLGSDASKNIVSITALPSGTTATTQGAGTNNTTVATTAFVTSTFAPAVTVSSESTLTLAYGRDYVFGGTTATYTLPAVSAGNATRADIITIKNRGSGNITLNSNTGSTIYDGSAVSSITIAPGSAVTLVQDATYFNKE